PVGEKRRSPILAVGTSRYPRGEHGGGSSMSSNHDDSVLPFGVYETPVTARVRERLERTKSAHPTAGIRLIDEHDEVNAHRYQVAVSRGISRVLERRLGELGSPAERLALINSITKVLGNDEVIDSEELLYAIFDTELAAAPALRSAERRVGNEPTPRSAPRP